MSTKGKEAMRLKQNMQMKKFQLECEQEKDLNEN